jgi:signal peptidase I
MNQQLTNGGRNKWFALLMGLVMPGLGQIYNGELIRGVSYFIILLALYVIGARSTVMLPDSLLLLGALVTFLAAVAVYIFAVVDAYREARKASHAYQRTRYNRWYFYIATWLLGSVLVTGGVFSYVRDNFVEAYFIATGSMEPAVRAGDRILADKTAYHRMAPKRGDVVTFIYPDDRSKKFIKRIEGLPGDVVTFADGTKKEVPHGFVYVLGDNRENSYDSRRFGFIPLSDVIAKAREIYFSSGADGIRWSRIGTTVGSK